MDQAALRKLWREYHNIAEQAYHAWQGVNFEGPRPAIPPMPEVLKNLTCGAKTRAGTPCKRKDLYTSGRCRLHGGLSTGPTTTEGKAKSAKNGFKPGWRQTDPMRGSGK